MFKAILWLISLGDCASKCRLRFDSKIAISVRVVKATVKAHDDCARNSKKITVQPFKSLCRLG